MNDTTIPFDGCITCERRGHVLMIGMNRPAKRNGFTPAMFRQLGEAYTLLDDDPGLRVGVLHAFGAHFTAGLDLPTIAPLMRRGEKAIPLGLVDPVNLGLPGYRRRTKPMVAAVKGITYTLGIELMLAADIVVAADDCRFSQLEVKRGIMATGGATLRMTERAGLGNAMLHLLTGDEFGSAEALRLNFVQKVVPAGEELVEALDAADGLFLELECGVVGVPDPVTGEKVKLVVVKKDPAITKEDLIAHCKSLLAGYKVPRDIRFEEIPKTSTGKIQKFQLRQRAKGI